MYFHQKIYNSGGCNQAWGNMQAAGVTASGSASGKQMLYFSNNKNRSIIIMRNS
jgi:hypothetical protein